MNAAAKLTGMEMIGKPVMPTVSHGSDVVDVIDLGVPTFSQVLTMKFIIHGKRLRVAVIPRNQPWLKFL